MSTQESTGPTGHTELTGHHAIAPRRVSFVWETTPLHWIPDEPTATHVINVLHLLLPAGERRFVKVFKEGLPLVDDPELLGDVKGFMGQEATHSVQHAYVLDHLAAQRLDTGDFTKYVDFLFERLLGERPPLGAPVSTREWLRFRLSVVAAIEQFTAVLGNWVLHAEGLDAAGTDEVMLDLLRRRRRGGGRAPRDRVRHVPALRRRGPAPLCPCGSRAWPSPLP